MCFGVVGVEPVQLSLFVFGGGFRDLVEESCRFQRKALLDLTSKVCVERTIDQRLSRGLFDVLDVGLVVGDLLSADFLKVLLCDLFYLFNQTVTNRVQVHLKADYVRIHLQSGQECLSSFVFDTVIG